MWLIVVGVLVIWWKHFEREKSWKTYNINLSFSLTFTRAHAQPSCFCAEPAPSPCPPLQGFAIKQQGNLPWWPDVLWYFSTDNIKWEVKCCNTCSCWLCTHSAQAASTLLKPTPPIKKLNYLFHLGYAFSPKLHGARREIKAEDLKQEKVQNKWKTRERVSHFSLDTQGLCTLLFPQHMHQKHSCITFKFYTSGCRGLHR